MSRLAGRSKVVGFKQTRRALNDGRALKVFLALDADPALTASLESLCQERKVDVEWCESMSELGQLCEITVGAAAAALVF